MSKHKQIKTINYMNNLNKKMSLALKLMTLAVIMNVATGCGSCKDGKDDDKDKKANEEVKLAISFKKKALKGEGELKTEIEITNNGTGEFDPSTSEITLVISKAAGTFNAEHTTIKVGPKSGDGKAELVDKLSGFLTEKIESKKSKTITFAFTDLKNDDDEKVTITATLKDKDKDGKVKDINSDKLTWERN
jgi:hypothetical protein